MEIRLAPPPPPPPPPPYPGGGEKPEGPSALQPTTESGMKFVVQVGISLQAHLQPVRYVPTILTYIVWGADKCD